MDPVKFGEPSKNPTSLFGWIKSHKVLSVAATVMGGIIVLVGILITTGQQLTIGGINLNPMINQAACNSDAVKCSITSTGSVPHPSSGGGSSTPPNTALAITGKFPVGAPNKPYGTAIMTVNAHGSFCEFTLDSVRPGIRGAVLVPQVNVAATEETTVGFNATPPQPGTYLVDVSVVCPPKEGDGPTFHAQKEFTWQVSLESPPSDGLDITGNFSDGNVGKTYTTTVNTVNALGSHCTFNLIGINPKVSDAAVKTISNPARDPETHGTFSATPQSATTYTVSIGVDCPPTAGDGPTRHAQKDFAWKVTGSSSGGGGGGGGGGGSSSTACTDSQTLNKLTAVYRWWSAAASDHFYTTNANEKPSGYRFEGVSGYVFNTQVTGTSPIYRNFSSSALAHYYSTDESGMNGYNREGIIGYAPTSSGNGATAWYRMFKNEPGADYLETTSAQEKSAVVELGYADQGTVAYLCGAAQNTELQPVFRLWGAGDGDHFYTTNFAERDALLGRGYVAEGITGYIYGTRKDGTLPLYRSYSRAIGDHFYTTSEAEAHSAGYAFEGIMGYISASDTNATAPLHRLFNSAIGDHLYTSDDNEASTASAHGYRAEGDTGFIYTAQ